MILGISSPLLGRDVYPVAGQSSNEIELLVVGCSRFGISVCQAAVTECVSKGGRGEEE